MKNIAIENENIDLNTQSSSPNSSKYLLSDFNSFFQSCLNQLPESVEKEGEVDTFSKLNMLISTYEKFRTLLSPEDENYFKNDFQQKILPYTNQSELCKYCSDKPRGYAGDFMAMQMIWNGRTNTDYRYRGKSEIGKIINAFTLDSANCKANIYRVHYLKKKFLNIKIAKSPQSAAAL